MEVISVEKENEKKDVVKHTSLIHCSNSLSLLQRKISNVLLYHAYNSLHEKEEHKISIKELSRYLNFKSHNHDALKQALKALISTVLEWNLIEDSRNENWTASSILASVNIKDAICTYAYSPRMRQLLYSPSMYGKINLLVQSNFTSSYGLALYENCVRYKNIDRTKVFPIELFRKLMGVSKNQYLIFRDFKKRVIDKAVNEINTVSDINVTANISRVGNKVVSIYFDVKEREKKKKFFVNITNEPLQKHCVNDELRLIENKLRNIFYVDESNIRALIKVHGTEKILKKVNQIESSSSFLSGKINNLAGFIIDALKKDYLPTKSSKECLNEKRKEKEGKNLVQKEMELQNALLAKKYENYVRDKLNEIILGFDKESSEKMKEHFSDYLTKTKNTLILNRFSKDGFSKTVLIFFRQFLEQYYPQLSSNILTSEQFFKSLTS